MADDRGQSLQGASTCSRSPRWQPGDESHKRGLNTKVHLAVDAHGLPLRVIVTEGTRVDCTQAKRLTEGICADYLIADKGYDTDLVIEDAKARGIEPVIPPKKNRKVQRLYDKALYRYRHLVENAFLHLKRWRGIAARYAKNHASFIAIIQIRCLTLWLNIS